MFTNPCRITNLLSDNRYFCHREIYQTVCYNSFPRDCNFHLNQLFYRTIPGDYKLDSDITHVTDTDFEDNVLKSDLPVLVDFWAEWCGPCKSVNPILEEITSEYSGRLKVAKLNVDENRKSPEQYGIRGIPTLIIFKNGDAKATHVGSLTKSQLTAFIDQSI